MASALNQTKSRKQLDTSAPTKTASSNASRLNQDLSRLLPHSRNRSTSPGTSHSAPEDDQPGAVSSRRHHPGISQRVDGQQQIGREIRQAQRSTESRIFRGQQPPSSAEHSDDELLLTSAARPSAKSKKRARVSSDDESNTDDSDSAHKGAVKFTIVEEGGVTQAVAAFSWKDFGRRYPRLVDPWDDISTVLTTGYTAMEARELTVANVLNTNGEVNRKETQKAEERQKHLYQIYCRVLLYKQSLHRTIHKALKDGNQDFINTIATQMRSGSKSSRGADINSISHAIWKWIPNGNELEIKERRGFQSPITGRLLMPAKKPFTAGLFDDYYNQTIHIKPTQIPRFCYDQFNSENINGYFSKLLRYSAVLILHGPSCVDTSGSSLGLVTKSSKGSKKSNADKCGIDSMTPALLAYISTLVFYALTNATQFGPAPLAFPIQRFYYTVLKQFGDPQQSERNNKLLKRWDEFLWPGLHGDDSDDSDYDNFTEQSDGHSEITYSSDRDHATEVAHSLMTLSRPPIAGPSTSRSYYTAGGGKGRGDADADAAGDGEVQRGQMASGTDDEEAAATTEMGT